MNAYRIALCIMLLVAMHSFSGASEEEYLFWDQVKIITPPHKETGMVIFEASAAGGTYRSIALTAFGKHYEIKRSELSRFTGFPLSSLVTTHEAGYPELGGHTVHFKLKRSRYAASTLYDDHLRISISRNKGLEIHGPDSKRR